jgi:hypothetical protein
MLWKQRVGGWAVLLSVFALAQNRDWVLSREITEKADVLAHFPLQIGNRWTYEHEHKTGNPERPGVAVWTSEVTVLGHVQVPEGLVVLRKVEAPQAPSDQRETEHYLIRGNYVYAVPDLLWDAKRQSLDDTFRQRLAQDDITPEFFFPLREGLLWAEKDRENRTLRGWLDSKQQPDGFYHWFVQGRGGQGRAVKLLVSSQAFLLVYATLGGPVERWFEDGVGVVGEWNRHGGTYWETTVRLKEFIPAR